MARGATERGGSWNERFLLHFMEMTSDVEAVEELRKRVYLIFALRAGGLDVRKCAQIAADVYRLVVKPCLRCPLKKAAEGATNGIPLVQTTEAAVVGEGAEFSGGRVEEKEAG